MNPSRQDEQVIRDWLASDAPFELDELVLDATFSRSRRTRQRGRPWGWRTSSMNRFSAFATGAVAIAIVVVGAALLLRSPNGSVGNQPGASAVASASPPAVGPSVPATTSAPSPAAPSSPAAPVLQLAIVDRDGTIREDLGLPGDSWMADLAADGKKLAFLTRSPDAGFCGACVAGVQRLAILDVGQTTGAFVYPDSDPPAADAGGAWAFQEPAWSPDGTKVAFVSPGPAGDNDIYVIALHSNGATLSGTVKQLTTDPAADEFPAWTPDGRTILYDNGGSQPLDGSGFSDTQEIWSVPAAGGTPKRLTNNDQSDAMPDVAADGTVAFWRQGEIWSMDLRGGHQIRLLAASDLFNPRWSPDGRTLAALRYDQSSRVSLPANLGLPTDLPTMNVVLLDVASRRLTAVGPNVAADFNPVSWTPDGSALLIDRYMPEG